MAAQQASPLEALSFIDGILSKVAGSRQDHAAIEGALGIIANALTPTPPAPPADLPEDGEEGAEK